MRIRYHPDASKDLDEAYEWYESQKLGLGLKFVDEAEATIQRILNFPELHPIITKKHRRAILPAFPYGVVYSVIGDLVEVYAFAHLHRLPFYWKKRTSKK
jgi:plasmid stabilization system protein ParE